ncbi:MAG TPA: hypothetical protein VKP69_19280 [Isosphaeraceae bacterium]|nr:hypothetical protein [Isosphaeraceae bacterium]
MTPHYGMVVSWSDESRALAVILPESSDLSQPCTQGASGEGAARNGREVLELLIEDSQSRGKPSPEPRPTLAGSA